MGIHEKRIKVVGVFFRPVWDLERYIYIYPATKKGGIHFFFEVLSVQIFGGDTHLGVRTWDFWGGRWRCTMNFVVFCVFQSYECYFCRFLSMFMMAFLQPTCHLSTFEAPASTHLLVCFIQSSFRQEWLHHLGLWSPIKTHIWRTPQRCSEKKIQSLPAAKAVVFWKTKYSFGRQLIST